MAPKYILEQFLQQELLINITEHEVGARRGACVGPAEMQGLRVARKVWDLGPRVGAPMSAWRTGVLKGWPWTCSSQTRERPRNADPQAHPSL